MIHIYILLVALLFNSCRDLQVQNSADTGNETPSAEKSSSEPVVFDVSPSPNPTDQNTDKPSAPVVKTEQPLRFTNKNMELTELMDWYFTSYAKIAPGDRLLAQNQIKSKIMALLLDKKIKDYENAIHKIVSINKSHPEISYELLWHLQKAWEVIHLPQLMASMHSGAKYGTFTGITVAVLSIAATFYDFRNPAKLPASISNFNRRIRLVRFVFPVAGYVAGGTIGEQITLPPSPAHVAQLPSVLPVSWDEYEEKQLFDDLKVTSAGISATLLVGKLAWAMTASRFLKWGSRLGRLGAVLGIGAISYGAGELASAGVDGMIKKQDIHDARMDLEKAFLRYRQARFNQDHFAVYWEAQQVSRSCQVYALRLQAEIMGKFDAFVSEIAEIHSAAMEREYREILAELNETLPTSKLITAGDGSFDLNAWRDPASPAYYRHALLNYYSGELSYHMVDVLLQCAAMLEDLNKPFVSHLTEELLDKAYTIDFMRRLGQ